MLNKNSFYYCSMRDTFFIVRIYVSSQKIKKEKFHHVERKIKPQNLLWEGNWPAFWTGEIKSAYLSFIIRHILAKVQGKYSITTYAKMWMGSSLSVNMNSDFWIHFFLLYFRKSVNGHTFIPPSRNKHFKIWRCC